MEFKLNASPHLKMHEITKKLFNRNFLSDIQFSLDGKIIYAHSLELMKRSVVFEEQLEKTLGDKKLIPITDCTYGSFLEFIRFIYTDDCNINDKNGIELLKLATKYQVIMLESRIINLLTTVDWSGQLFEHCVIEKYDLARNFIDGVFANNLDIQLRVLTCRPIHPDAINKALEFDAVPKDVTEIEIFNALVEWIENYCDNHEMSLSEGRQQFDVLIKKVRFPAMLNEQIRECTKNYPDLLSESDLNSIARQIVLGSDNVNDLWISKPRGDYIYPYKRNKFIRDTTFETKFSVSKETILRGIIIGIEKNRKDIEIEIAVKNSKTNEIEKTTFTQSPPAHWNLMVINLSHSLFLLPNYEYTIAVKFLEITNEHINVTFRNENIDLIYNDADNAIQIIAASGNMLEMCFKVPPE